MCKLCDIAPGVAVEEPWVLPEGCGWSWQDEPHFHRVTEPETEGSADAHVFGMAVSLTGIEAELSIQSYDDGISIVEATTEDGLGVRVMTTHLKALQCVFAAIESVTAT